MKMKMPTGLFDKLSSQLLVIELLPRPVLKVVGPLLVPLKIMPEDGRSAAKALMAPHVRDASIEFLKMAAEWMLAAKRARKRGEKVILVPFNFPSELIHAFTKA
ncbi:MAG TPA: hypothetical protein VM658_17325, partial [bacterium]|nr:hypothetical protein [bacterium]